MKFSAIAVLAFQAISTVAQDGSDVSFWRDLVDNVDSFPTRAPTRPPTGECKIETKVECTIVMNGDEIDCDDVPPEEMLTCECEDCVRGLKFRYTGLGCDPTSSASGKCVDSGPNPRLGEYRITSCEDSTLTIDTGIVLAGDTISFSSPGDSCLPECLIATINERSGGPLTQTVEIDSTCDGGSGLISKTNYGAFESIGYSCSETDTHNCVEDAVYDLEVCNTGSTKEQIYFWDIVINKEEVNLLKDGPVKLNPGDCYSDTYEDEVDRCVTYESCIEVTATATNPETNLPPSCPAEDELCFGWELNPTPPPVPGSTPPPTPAPTRPPTPGPTPPPVPVIVPTSPPTGECSIGSGINCTTIMDNKEIDCKDIPQEVQPTCKCPECVRQLQFKYTGLACSPGFSGSGKCVDEGPNPFVAGYRITDCEDSTVIVASGEVQQDNFIMISPTGTALDCLPKSLCVTISVPSGAVTQTHEIDDSCDGGNGLTLSSSYGAFESIGYSCDQTDTHNCFQVVSYGVNVCNTGSTEEEQIYDWTLNINKEELDLLKNVAPADVTLRPGECIYDTISLDVNRCMEWDMCAEVDASFTNPSNGLPANCDEKDELCFGWEGPPPAAVTPSPSPFPSPAPSPSPTSSCVIDVNLNGCPQYNSSLDNDCQGRPWEITFRYNGGSCAQSDNLQPRQKFTCVDNNGGPSVSEGAMNYITAVPRGGSELYFAGNVAVNEKYTLNQDRVYDKLSADMTITIFDVEGGSILQTTDLHLSCSQPLFLFDKFGASQVTEWVETSGRVVSDKQSDVETGTIKVELNTSTDVVKPVRLLEMTVLTNTQDQPIDYTSQVAGTVLGPGDVIELPGFQIDIDLSARTRYTFFTTIIGETLDGTNQCNGFSFLECTIGFNLLPVFPTSVPTPSPTITPYPTNDAGSTSCDITAGIKCDVLSLDGVECKDILAPTSETCPEDAELLVAYLKYDGSLGDNVFVELVCDESTTYIDKTYSTGEVIAFRTRANACAELAIIVSDSDPDNGGSNLSSETLSTACPGPWTIGSTIGNAFMLEAFIDTEDDGATFAVNVLEAEVEFSYTAENSGQFPLTVVSGEISDTITATNGEVARNYAVEGVSVSVPPRQTTTLQTSKETISLGGRSGDTVVITLSLSGQTDNEFALPCEDTTTVTFNL